MTVNSSIVELIKSFFERYRDKLGDKRAKEGESKAVVQLIRLSMEWSQVQIQPQYSIAQTS